MADAGGTGDGAPPDAATAAATAVQPYAPATPAPMATATDEPPPPTEPAPTEPPPIQLLYFDNVAKNPELETQLRVIAFDEPVRPIEMRILPHGFNPPGLDAAFRGRTRPDVFALRLYARDLDRPDANRFVLCATLQYNAKQCEGTCFQTLNCPVTDRIVVGGAFHLITVCLYGQVFHNYTPGLAATMPIPVPALPAGLAFLADENRSRRDDRSSRSTSPSKVPSRPAARAARDDPSPMRRDERDDSPLRGPRSTDAKTTRARGGERDSEWGRERERRRTPPLAGTDGASEAAPASRRSSLSQSGVLDEQRAAGPSSSDQQSQTSEQPPEVAAVPADSPTMSVDVQPQAQPQPQPQPQPGVTAEEVEADLLGDCMFNPYHGSGGVQPRVLCSPDESSLTPVLDRLAGVERTSSSALLTTSQTKEEIVELGNKFLSVLSRDFELAAAGPEVRKEWVLSLEEIAQSLLPAVAVVMQMPEEEKRQHSAKLLGWVLAALDLEGATQLDSVMNVRQVKAGFRLAGAILSSDSELSQLLLERGVLRRLCDVIEGGLCSALLRPGLLAMTAALDSAYGAEVFLGWAQAGEGAARAADGIKAEEGQPKQLTCYQRMVRVLLRSDSVFTIDMLQRLLHKANLYAALGNLQAEIEVLLAAADKDEAVVVDGLAQRLNNLIGTLVALYESDEANLFDTHTSGSCEAQQPRSNDLPCYIFRLMSARRTLESLNLCLGYLMSDEGMDIYQAVKDMVLLLLRGGTGLVYLACRPEAASTLVEMLHAWGHNVVMQPNEEAQDPFPLDVYCENSSRTMCPPQALALLVTYHLQAVGLLDGLLRIDAAGLAAAWALEKQAALLLQGLLATATTPCGEAAVANVLLRCGGAPWLFQLMLSLREAAPTRKAQNIAAPVPMCTLAALEVLLIVLRHDTGAAFMAPFGGALHAHLAAASYKNETATREALQWLAPLEGAATPAVVPVQALCELLASSAGQGIFLNELPTLLSSLRLLCVAASRQLGVVELFAHGAGEILCLVLQRSVEYLQRRSTPAASQTQLHSVVTLVMDLLRLLIDRIPEGGSFPGDVEALVGSLFELFVTVNTFSLRNPDGQDQLVAGGNGHVYLRLQSDLINTFEVLLYPRTEPRSADEGGMDTSMDPGGHPAHHEALAALLQKTASRPAAFGSGLQLLCELLPDVTAPRTEAWGKSVAANARDVAAVVATLADTSCHWHMQLLRDFLEQAGRLNKAVAMRILAEAVTAMQRELSALRIAHDAAQAPGSGPTAPAASEHAQQHPAEALARILFVCSPLLYNPHSRRCILAVKVRGHNAVFDGVSTLCAVAALPAALPCVQPALALLLCALQSQDAADQQTGDGAADPAKDRDKAARAAAILAVAIAAVLEADAPLDTVDAALDILGHMSTPARADVLRQALVGAAPTDRDFGWLINRIGQALVDGQALVESQQAMEGDAGAGAGAGATDGAAAAGDADDGANLLVGLLLKVLSACARGLSVAPDNDRRAVLAAVFGSDPQAAFAGTLAALEALGTGAGVQEAILGLRSLQSLDAESTWDYAPAVQPVPAAPGEEWQRLVLLATDSEEQAGSFDVELNLSELVASHCPSALKDEDSMELPTKLHGSTTRRPNKRKYASLKTAGLRSRASVTRTFKNARDGSRQDGFRNASKQGTSRPPSMHVDDFVRKEFGLDDKAPSKPSPKPKPQVSPRRTHQPRIAHREQNGQARRQPHPQHQPADAGATRRANHAPRSFQLASVTRRERERERERQDRGREQPRDLHMHPSRDARGGDQPPPLGSRGFFSPSRQAASGRPLPGSRPPFPQRY